MTRPVIGFGAAVACTTLALWGVAEARNPHCAGGIQYVVQAMRDKEKGNTEDYEREIHKAVFQLKKCAVEDTNDVEALGYLGWAYAEVDSAEQAGKTFARAIARLKEKGDRKKVEWAQNNRDSYWATAFNQGIARIADAQNAYPDFTKEPETAADSTLRGEAAQRYREALYSLTQASLLKPGDGRTIRNLGTVHALMGDYARAEAALSAGLQAAPRDSDLVAAVAAVRSNHARRLIAEERYDEAIAKYEALVRFEPNNVDHRVGLADAHFKRAQIRKEEERNRDFKVAGDAYAKGAELRPGSGDLAFNAALAYQNAGEFGLAEAQWRGALKHSPEDVEAMSSLGWALAEQKKHQEAIKILHQAVSLKPQNRTLHRQLGAVYTKAGNNAKATEELMVYLALQNGQEAADPAAQAAKAGAASAAGKTRSTLGTPEQVYVWDADDEKYETWFYWSKKQAYHFKAGALVQKSDWAEADLTAAGGK